MSAKAFLRFDERGAVNETGLSGIGGDVKLEAI
jgi:hypothetical protein